MLRPASTVLLFSLLAACGDGGGRGGDSDTNQTGVSGISGISGLASDPGGTSEGGTSLGTTEGGVATEGGVTTEGDPATSEPNPSSNSDGLKFDLPVVPDAGPLVPETGCAKVDLLFVIDNSGSMADEQATLVASFPEFVAEMQSKLSDTESYHVGVTTSDNYVYNKAGCAQHGGLVTQTGGDSSSNQVCGPYATGKNFMNETDDLGTRFACAGRVGVSGDGNEQPMTAMLKAVGPGLAQAGACNEGFIREDALLVVVVITDEEDDHEVQACAQDPQSGSPGDPPNWYNQLVMAKGGVETNIVVLALTGPVAQPCPALDKCNGGIQGAETATRVVQFAEMFTYGSVGQICAPSYKQFFSDAISVIDTACENFTPPG